MAQKSLNKVVRSWGRLAHNEEWRRIARWRMGWKTKRITGLRNNGKARQKLWQKWELSKGPGRVSLPSAKMEMEICALLPNGELRHPNIAFSFSSLIHQRLLITRTIPIPSYQKKITYLGSEGPSGLSVLIDTDWGVVDGLTLFWTTHHKMLSEVQH